MFCLSFLLIRLRFSSRHIDETFSYALNDGLSLIHIYRDISKQCKPRSDCDGDSRDRNFCIKKSINQTKTPVKLVRRVHKNVINLTLTGIHNSSDIAVTLFIVRWRMANI